MVSRSVLVGGDELGEEVQRTDTWSWSIITGMLSIRSEDRLSAANQ